MFCHGQGMVTVRWQKKQAQLCTKCGRLTTFEYILGKVKLTLIWPPRKYGNGGKKRVKCS